MCIQCVKKRINVDFPHAQADTTRVTQDLSIGPDDENLVRLKITTQLPTTPPYLKKSFIFLAKRGLKSTY